MSAAEPLVPDDFDDSNDRKKLVYVYPGTLGPGTESYMRTVDDLMEKNELFSTDELGFKRLERATEGEWAVANSVSIKKRDMESLGAGELLTDNVVDIFATW